MATGGEPTADHAAPTTHRSDGSACGGRRMDRNSGGGGRRDEAAPVEAETDRGERWIRYAGDRPGADAAADHPRPEDPCADHEARGAVAGEGGADEQDQQECDHHGGGPSVGEKRGSAAVKEADRIVVAFLAGSSTADLARWHGLTGRQVEDILRRWSWAGRWIPARKPRRKSKPEPHKTRRLTKA